MFEGAISKDLSIRAVDDLQDLLDDAALCRNKMQAASALIDGLSGERVRWTEQSKEFKAQINRQVLSLILTKSY